MSGATAPGPTGWLQRWYGSGPAHLVTIVLGGLVGLYAATKLLTADPWGVAIWFVATAVIHDLVLVPAYCGIDRLARRSIPSDRTAGSHVPFWYDHIRVPVLLSGLLLLVFFPLVLAIPARFEGITGTSVDVYLGRYLAVVAGLFALSAVALAVRITARSARRRRGRR